MAGDFNHLVQDLATESTELIALIEPLEEEIWCRPTPAEGWTIHDQVVHLAHFDDATRLSIVDPVRFRAERPPMTAIAAMVRAVTELGRAQTARDVLAWFRRARSGLVDAVDGIDPRLRVPWYGPDMSVGSAISARIMETWAHGQDIVDALGIERQPTGRLFHVAFLCTRAVPNSYRARNLDPPDTTMRFELVGPHGELWKIGPADASNIVAGPAVDLCLLATQRVHRDDTKLTAHGEVADQWLSIAQAFAGPPGLGRRPRSPTPTGR